MEQSSYRIECGALPIPQDEKVVLDWLRAFVASPSSLSLQGAPFLERPLLRWLIERLAWASESGGMETGSVFGEVAPHQEPLPLAETVVIRVRMDDHRLPRERNLHPIHNLAEAWQVASHVQAPRPLTLWLACADVDFQYLVPPSFEKPGSVHWGPTYFGFRLFGAETPATTDPVLLPFVLSSDPLEVDQLNRLIQVLAKSLLEPRMELLPFLPAIASFGHLLPAGIRSAFAERLEGLSNSQAIELISKARAAVGSS